MATYTIVAQGTSPLGPNEIPAGQTIQVADGDTYIVSGGVDSDVVFEAAGGGPVGFRVEFGDAIADSVKFAFGSGLTPEITIADNTDLSEVTIDAAAADAITITAGDGVDLGKYDGSQTGDDTITVGANFTAHTDWSTLGGNDVLSFGANATLNNLKTGTGNDQVTFGDGATLNDLDAEDGADRISFGDELQANQIKAGDGDDRFILGSNAQATKFDGGGGNDMMTTQTAGTENTNIETVTVVCFAAGTRIATARGQVPVERLRVGDLLLTRDHGPQPLRWIGRMTAGRAAQQRSSALRPVRNAAGALGGALPESDLLVSPQHRVLLRSPIVARVAGEAEVLVAAHRLVGVPGITAVAATASCTYYHLLLARHEILFANGAEAESFLPGAEALRVLTDRGRGTLPQFARRPAPLPDRIAPLTACRAIVAGAVARNLIARHVKNAKPLQSPLRAGAAALMRAQV